MFRVALCSLFGIVVMSGGCGGGSGAGGTGGGGTSGTGGAGGDGVGGVTGSGGTNGAGGAGGTSATGGSGALAPPSAFTLVAPLQGSSAQPLTPDLQWNAADGATSYTVEVATAATFGVTDVVNQFVGGTATDFTIPASTLEAGVIYFWRVTAVNGGGSTVATAASLWFSSPYLISGAHGIAVTPDGTRLVVASDINNGPIDVVTIATRAITSVGTGVPSQPMGVALSPDGTQALATLLTNGNGGVNGVAVIDLTTNTLTGTIADPCVGTTLGDVAYFPSGTEAAIPDLSSGCAAMGLSTFTPNLGSPNFMFVNFGDTNDPDGVAISPNGAFALVTMALDDRLYQVTFPGTVSHLSLSSTSSGVAITPDGTKAVVAEATADVITLASGSIAPVALMNNDTPNLDFHNVAITPDGTEAVVVGVGSVQVISLTSNTVVASYPADGGTSVAISPDGTTAFVTDMADGWVRVLQMP